MSEIAELSVDVVANDKVTAFLAKLEAQLDRANTKASQAGQGIGRGIGQGARQASDSTLTLAQAQARLLSTTGQNQQAYGTLSSALAQNSGSQLQNVRAATQLAQIQNRLSGQSQSLTSLFGQMGQQLSGLGGAGGQAAGALGGLAGSLGTIGGIGAALSLGKVAVDLSVAGANADLVRQRFDSLAVAAGTSGEAMLTALRKASGGEISDLNLELAANRARLLGVAKSAEQFSALLTIARDRAQLMGITVTDAFQRLVDGLGKAEPELLDELGIIVNGTEANAKYAASLGISTAALTKQQRSMALANAVYAQANASLTTTGGAVNSTAGTFQQFNANLANTTSGIGSFLSGGLAPLADQFNQTVSATTTATSAIVAFFQGLDPARATAAAAGMDAYRNAIQHGATEADAQAAAEKARAAATTEATTATVASVGPMQAAAAAATGHASAVQLAIAAAKALTADLQSNAEAAVLAAAQQNAQATATANLTEQTNAAVTAFLNLNPAIDAGGIAAAVTAGKIPPLIGELAKLRIAAYSARDAIAALAAQQAINVKSLAPGGVGAFAPGRTSGKNNDINAVLALQKAQKDAADARSDQLLQLGSDQQKLTELQRIYNDTVKQSGADSAAAIQAETRLKQARQAQIAASTKASKAGGAARLSDQQKLDNSLLASQEQYAQKSEQAESDHWDRVLQINADFAEKIKKAQDDFAQSQLEGRAGFYDSLGSIEDAGLRQALSAQYEAAFQEADAIAREKGADVGQQFLEAKQAAIQAQGQRASEIAEATKAGDKDKADYLAGVDTLYRDAEERKLNAIKAGEGSVAAERDAALAEESAKYGEAQTKIGDSADQAAQRKILAAERAGQAVDTEIAKVNALGLAYDRVGVSGARAGIGPAVAPTAAPTAAPAPAGANAPGDVVVALQAAQAAIVGALQSVIGAERETSSAVRSLGSRFQS